VDETAEAAAVTTLDSPFKIGIREREKQEK